MDMHFEGIVFHTHAAELARRLGHSHPPFAVLDIRSKREHDRLRVPGSVCVDPKTLDRLPAGTTPATELFVISSDPADAALRSTALRLKKLGALRVVEVGGGMWEWVRKGLPLEGSGAAA